MGHSTGCSEDDISGRIRLTACCETATGHESRYDSVPCILFLPVPFHSTVKCGEHTTPNTKVATGDGCTGLNGGNRASEAFTLGPY
jgi:hypothetical protein